MNNWLKLISASVLLMVLSTSVAADGVAKNESRVAAVLDDLHDAASKADYDRYFGLYATDAIFLGTDATERWSIDEFKAYARPSFEQGRGWTYVPTSRWVSVSADGNTAWFDETLENASYGECRGSGVLVNKDGRWLITQYNLTIPIPNALANEFADRIKVESSGQ